MTIPAALRQEVEVHLGPIEPRGAVGGGCIHPACRVSAREGDFFLKYGLDTTPGFFAAEAEGLRQLAAATRVLRVPAVVAHGDTDAARHFGWIVLEWLEPGNRSPDFPSRLAEGLSELHSPLKTDWGWEIEGFIGSLPQRNAVATDWPTFWRRSRLEPQLALARERGRLPATEREWSALLDRLPDLLAAGGADGPSLLHGDLWGGNILATSAGDPALVDPAVYRGHREVDLAMSELFGGLPETFYREYDAIRPLQPGYREWRRGIYQLYYLLVHVNLFGDGYVAQTAATLRSVLSSV